MLRAHLRFFKSKQEKKIKEILPLQVVLFAADVA